ncbi:CoA ester lyase [Halomonas sp.]|jgi:citrate lyase subunit beta/citryl-CoA lyase|uniref:HpcH/HpaI aldolase/citrate lyase family protein n=1 Tax=Halomonas sp. TaxID=1486246 RepID=UPI0035625B90
MKNLTSIRSPLFVPANRPDRFGKAATSGADAVILDLEDAVAADAKVDARTALSCDFTTLPIIVRINANDTAWHGDDLKAVLGLPIAAVMLPKSEDPAQIAAVVAALAGHAPILALVETARGIANARTIAALPGVSRLIFGSVDYCADLGCAHVREALLAARCELVLASRLASIAAPIDGVTTQLDDPDVTEGDARHARDLGMTGKLCIHPSQVDVVQEVFVPSAVEIDWANRVLASGDGATTVNGAMVDEPVRIRARTILASLPSKTK